MSEAPDGRGPLFLADLPRFVFFTGKGGVGKTSLACAAAVRLAEAGSQVLLVSTDPASNVGQVFGRRIGNTITRIVDVPGLDAIEIDPQQAADAYRARIIDPVRELLPASEVAAARDAAVTRMFEENPEAIDYLRRVVVTPDPGDVGLARKLVEHTIEQTRVLREHGIGSSTRPVDEHGVAVLMRQIGSRLLQPALHRMWQLAEIETDEPQVWVDLRRPGS